MKRILSVILAALMIGFVFTGCKSAPKADAASTPAAGQNGSAEPDKAQVEEALKDVAEEADVEEIAAASAGMFNATLSDIIEKKSELVERLSNGLMESENGIGATMELMGITVADLMLIPFSMMGLESADVESGLAVLGNKDVEYTKTGDNYALIYTDNSGVKWEAKVEHNPAKDCAQATLGKDGKDVLYYEYAKTSFGYACQYYTMNDDGTSSIYMAAFDKEGKNGCVGITVNAESAPASITDAGSSLTMDFCKSCKSWYQVNGTEGTGMTSDGNSITFTVPEEVE